VSAAVPDRSEAVEIGGRLVRLTSLDRVLWPSTGFTKRDMVSYYRSVADRLIPYLAGRPLTLGRFPMGVDGPGWAQTECRGRPDWMPTAPVRLRSGALRRYCLVEDEASLVWVANQGAIELHPFLWRNKEPERPLEIVFDLDPGPGVRWTELCRTALLIREELDRRGLGAWAKSSGAAGIHIHVPLEGDAPLERSFTATKGFARQVAGRLAASHPDLVVDRMDRSLRTGRTFVDWMQNEARRSIVAPWSLRATDVPSAAVPLEWSRLERCRPPRPAVGEARG
jgi:bifunctional non-homologous end joining protein LigD